LKFVFNVKKLLKSDHKIMFPVSLKTTPTALTMLLLAACYAKVTAEKHLQINCFDERTLS
jgi:hypothetical protein